MLVIMGLAPHAVAGAKKTVSDEPQLNACGCYRNSAGACLCGKKGKCECPGECEPKGCSEKRQKDLDREIQAETKRVQDVEKKKRDEEAEKKKREEEAEKERQAEAAAEEKALSEAVVADSPTKAEGAGAEGQDQSKDKKGKDSKKGKKADKAEKADKSEKADKAENADKSDKTDKTAKAEKTKSDDP
jgi:hypothetical protein